MRRGAGKPFVLLSFALITVLILVALASTPARAQDTSQPPQNPPGQDQPPPQPPQPKPDEKPKRHFYIGPDIGVFLPTSSKTQNRFGSAWLGIGPGIGPIAGVKKGGQFTPDIFLVSQSNNGNRAFVGLLGVDYRHPLGTGRKRGKTPNPPEPGQGGSGDKDNPAQSESRSLLTPYVGLSADLVLADLRSVADNVHSGVSAGGGGSVFLGLKIGRRAFLEARYLGVSSIKTFDLSGLSLTAGYRASF